MISNDWYYLAKIEFSIRQKLLFVKRIELLQCLTSLGLASDS